MIISKLYNEVYKSIILHATEIYKLSGVAVCLGWNYKVPDYLG